MTLYRGDTSATSAGALFLEDLQQPLIDGLIRNQRILRLFPWRKATDNAINWRVRYAGNGSADSYAEDTGAAGNAGRQAIMKATLAFKRTKVVAGATGFAQARAALASVRAGSDFFTWEVTQAAEDLAKEINIQLMADGTGNSSLDIDGIPAAVDDASTYAGLAQGSYAWWQSYMDDATTELSIAAMQAIKRTVEDSPRFGRVNLIICGPTLWNLYGNLLIADRRFVNPTVMDGGFSALDFEGVPVVKIPGYTAARMDFLTAEDWEYIWLPQPAPRSPLIGAPKMPEAAPDGYAFVPHLLGKTGDSDEVMITHYSNLCCRDPYHQGALTAITS